MRISDPGGWTTPFPHGFLWDAATAAHQVEGGNEEIDPKARPRRVGVAVSVGGPTERGPGSPASGHAAW